MKRNTKPTRWWCGQAGTARIVLLAATGVLASACASSPPENLDLRRTVLLPDRTAPELVLHGSSGKLTGASGGAAAGAGIGLLAGILGCAGTGPFVVLCAGTVIPATTAIGVVSGATAGAIRSEGSAAVDAKRTLLARELAAADYPGLLAQLVQTQAHEHSGAGLPSPEAGAAPADWTVEVTLLEIATDSSYPDDPFALRLKGRVRLRRAPGSDVVFEGVQYVRSEARLTTAQWSVEDAAPVRAALNQGLRELADRLLTKLCALPNGRSVCHRSSIDEPAVGSAATPSRPPAALPASKEVP
jgi:hypothetical protein